MVGSWLFLRRQVGLEDAAPCFELRLPPPGGGNDRVDRAPGSEGPFPRRWRMGTEIPFPTILSPSGAMQLYPSRSARRHACNDLR